MVCVRELLKLDALSEFELIAGGAGLERSVSGFAILDYELESEDYSDFRKGEFVLSSLLFRQEDPDTTINAVQQLLARGVAALAIRVFDFSKIPGEVTALADEAGVPLFLFRKVYVNDIIIAANEYSRAKERHEMAEAKLNELLGSPRSVAALVRDLDPMLMPCCMAAYARPVNGGGANSVIFRLMQRYSYSEKGVYRTFIPYAGGILLLISANDATATDPGDKAILARFADVGVTDAGYSFGVGSAVDSFEDYDVAIAEALRAAGLASARNVAIAHYCDAGVYRFLAAVREDRAAMRVYESALSVLARYDEANSAELVVTLAEYVRRRGDVKETAEALFQHPNTIRYRLKKATTLLGLSSDPYEQLFMIMSMYLMGK